MKMNTINQTTIIPPCGSPEDIPAGVAYVATLLFGLPTNGYVLWLIVSGRQEKIASDFIPLNQIAVESILCLSGIWYLLIHFLSLCILTKMFDFFKFIVIFMRPLVQSHICLEQYLATVHPVIFLRCKPLRYKVAVCCVSWLIAITLSVVGMFFLFQRALYFTLAALDLLLLLFMTFCCFSVLRALKRPAPGEGPRDQHRGNSMKKKAFKIILISLVYTTLSQIPMPVIISLMGEIPYSLVLNFSSVNVYIFVITGFVPSMMYLYRVGKLSSKCNCL